jgi:outer membrane receptor for ferrienterochelin and colicin
MKRKQKFTAAVATGLCLGQFSPTKAEEVEMSLADLMDIKVESISKRSESLISAPSAVYVISSEDIRNYGIHRIQDALRLVPGVVQVDKGYQSSEFNIREDLVEVPTTVAFLLDGVPIQNPVFGSVFFRGLDLPMEEIDRIEVIRGNGGTVYGANSVTGVVSIYTKKPINAQGFAAAVAGGYPGSAKGTLRYGGHMNLGKTSDWYVTGGMGYDKGYDQNGNFEGSTLSVPGPNNTTVQIKNKFTSDETDKAILWNGMVSWQTQWNDLLKTSVRFWGHGMEEKVYARKAYPFLTYNQASAAVIAKVLSKYITTASDIPTAANYLATSNTTALATMMATKGYVTPANFVGSVLPKYVKDPARIPAAVSALQSGGQTGLVSYLMTNGDITDPSAFAIAFQTDLVTAAMMDFQTKFTTDMTAAMTPLLSSPPADSVWVTDVHYRSYIANLRNDFNFSPDHQAFLNLNFTYSDNIWSEYKFATITPNNMISEMEAQDILNFQPSSFAKLEWITGTALRQVNYDIGPSVPASAMLFHKAQSTEWLRSGFVQGKATFFEDYDLITGIKGEQWTLINDDIQWMPSLRLVWRPLSNLTFWGAASRGATVPGYPATQMEARQASLPSYDPQNLFPAQARGKWVATTQPAQGAGAVDYKNLENGIRWQGKTTLVDVTSYYVWTKGRVATSPVEYETPIASSFNASDTIVPTYFSNLQDAELWGVEAMVRQRMTSWLTGEVSYAFHHCEITSDAGDASRVGVSKKSPQHIVKARSTVDLPANFTLAVDGEWLSSYDFLQKTYDYVNQRPDASGKLTTVENPGSVVHLNATLSRSFLDGKLTTSIYGKNLAALTPGYEAFDYQGTYPEKTGPTYGLDAKWGF